MKKIKILFPLVIAVCVITFFRYYFKMKKQKFIKEAICGVVDSKIRSSNSLLLSLKGSEKYNVNYLKLSDANLINIGDSICKLENELVINLYRNVKDEWVYVNSLTPQLPHEE